MCLNLEHPWCLSFPGAPLTSLHDQTAFSSSPRLIWATVPILTTSHFRSAPSTPLRFCLPGFLHSATSFIKDGFPSPDTRTAMTVVLSWQEMQASVGQAGTEQLRSMFMLLAADYPHLSCVSWSPSIRTADFHFTGHSHITSSCCRFSQCFWHLFMLLLS